MLRGFMVAAVAASAFALAPVATASAAETVTLDQAATLSQGFAHAYEAGKKVYIVPAYRYHKPYYRPRVYVRPYYPVYPVYKVKRPKVYVY